MNITRPSRLAAFGLAALLSGTAPALLAADPPPPPQYGPGMMNGYGGYGMGPGMMGGGYGMGPGMMGGYGGYGMGPGMMGGGYGMGPGMMGGGYGMGPGMMGGGMMGPYWGSGLDLTPDQQAKINKIQDETRKAHWALMGEMMDQQARLRDLNQAPKRDETAIAAAYKEFGKIQQKMYDSAVAAHTRMEALLTKEQKEKLRSYWRRGWAPTPEK